MIDLSSAPFPVAYRELWLPGGIRANTALPSSIYNGHELTLAGAQKRTTSDGVHFTGSATSNIVVAAAAGQNAQEAFAITIRFKLDSAFAAGAAANQYLFQKALDANNWIRVYLDATSGALYWVQGDGAGGAQFTLTSSTVSWAADTWYIVTCSLTNTPTQRLLVDGTVEDTDTQAAVATPNGGNMVIGSSADGGVDGVIGTISWVDIEVGTTAVTALTTDEEANLAKGFPPAGAKIQYHFLMDEGRGTTINDRGIAGGDGTLDSACTWAWGQVQQPVLSLDGINDRAYSSAGVDNSGDCTYVWVAKMKSTWSALAGTDHRFYFLEQTGGYTYLTYAQGIDMVYFSSAAGGGISLSSKPAIDDYWIMIVVDNNSALLCTMFLNGSLVGTDTKTAPIFNSGDGVMWIGRDFTFNRYYDVNKTLFFAQIGQAFTSKQALAYSRWLKNIFNLPITI